MMLAPFRILALMAALSFGEQTSPGLNEVDVVLDSVESGLCSIEAALQSPSASTGTARCRPATAGDIARRVSAKEYTLEQLGALLPLFRALHACQAVAQGDPQSCLSGAVDDPDIDVKKTVLRDRTLGQFVCQVGYWDAMMGKALIGGDLAGAGQACRRLQPLLPKRYSEPDLLARTCEDIQRFGGEPRAFCAGIFGAAETHSIRSCAAELSVLSGEGGRTCAVISERAHRDICLGLAEYRRRRASDAACGEPMCRALGGSAEACRSYADELVRVALKEDWSRLAAADGERLGKAAAFLFGLRKESDEGVSPASDESRRRLSRLTRIQERRKAVAAELAKIETRMPAVADEDSPAASAQSRRAGREIGIEWVKMPAGSFPMGSKLILEAQPIRQVTLPAFEIARTLVTVKQYKSCVEAGACAQPLTGRYCNWGLAGREDHPVNCLTWAQAKAFCGWVDARLPSEAEWEYAARSAGQEREYPWGDEAATCERAVFRNGESRGCGKDSTWPVCSKPQGNTQQGLCDMAGNLHHWVEDSYLSYDKAPSDGSAQTRPGANRVKRGGSFLDLASRSTARHNYAPGNRLDDIGFRPVRASPAAAD